MIFLFRMLNNIQRVLILFRFDCLYQYVTRGCVLHNCAIRIDNTHFFFVFSRVSQEVLSDVVKFY